MASSRNLFELGLTKKFSHVRTSEEKKFPSKLLNDISLISYYHVLYILNVWDKNEKNKNTKPSGFDNS